VLNLVDSSGWLEYFTNAPNAGFFAPAIEDTGTLLVPTIIRQHHPRHCPSTFNRHLDAG